MFNRCEQQQQFSYQRPPRAPTPSYSSSDRSGGRGPSSGNCCSSSGGGGGCSAGGGGGGGGDGVFQEMYCTFTWTT